MQRESSGRPSRTAMRVAAARAAHQLFDAAPRVLDDPVAVSIVGANVVNALRAEPRAHQGRYRRAMRAFLVARSRLAEDELARALARGATQYVILGAGLDTFPYRNPHSASSLRIFEVDHPATQAWKRYRLAEAGIVIPPALTFAPVDFERQSLIEGLAEAGFDAGQPTFFSWLGVTMYLTEDAITSTLSLIASTPPGGGLVFDYGVHRSSLGLVSRLALWALSRRVAAAGEPFRTFFDPRALARQLTQLGFLAVEDLGPRELNARYFNDRTDRLRVSGRLGRVMAAER